MNNTNSAYFRQRAVYHLGQAGRAEQGIAGIHRRFAQLYVEQAAKATRVARMRRAERRRRSAIARFDGAVPV